MSLEKQEETLLYICPECLAVYHLEIEEILERANEVLVCTYCDIPLKRGEEGEKR